MCPALVCEGSVSHALLSKADDVSTGWEGNYFYQVQFPLPPFILLCRHPERKIPNKEKLRHGGLSGPCILIEAV